MSGLRSARRTFGKTMSHEVFVMTLRHDTASLTSSRMHPVISNRARTRRPRSDSRPGRVLPQRHRAAQNLTRIPAPTLLPEDTRVIVS